MYKLGIVYIMPNSKIIFYHQAWFTIFLKSRLVWFKRLYHTRRDLNENANHAWRTTHWDQNKRRKCGRSFPTVFPRHDINFDSISCLDQNTCFAGKLVWLVKSLLHHAWCDWFKFRNITPKCIVQWNLVWFVKNMLHHTWCDWLKLRNITPDFIFLVKFGVIG